MSDHWLTQQEAADQLGVTVQSVRAYIARGHLPAYRVRSSRVIRVRQSDLDKLLCPIPTTTGGHRDAASDRQSRPPGNRAAPTAQTARAGGAP